MNRIAITCLLFLGALAPAWAAEPIVGNWQMFGMTAGGRHADPLPISLRITESGSSLQFNYVEGREEATKMIFTARLDGSETPIRNAGAQVIGTVRVSKIATGIYKVILQSPNRPPEPGKMTVSDKGRILTCESEANLPGQKGPVRIVQQFAKQ